MSHNERRSVFFTKRTLDELEALIKTYGENRSRVISRLINQAYMKLQEEKQNHENKSVS
jgi:metal-responsive CopG/Arc/MetJ family transcriptional regulator